MSAVLMGVVDVAGAFVLFQTGQDVQSMLAVVLLSKGLMSIFAPR